MIYDIRMTITYHYPAAAGAGRHLLRMLPGEVSGRQKLIAGDISVRPTAVERVAGQDFFGNRTLEVAFGEPHAEAAFELVARVERSGSGGLLDVSPRPGDLDREIASHPSLEPQAPHHFLGPSPRIDLHPKMNAYGAETASGCGTVHELVQALGRRIHAEFTFDPDATEVDTPALEAFERREGVCQDFSHIMISCLRGIGVPAGYVSGFLRTVPPEGQPRLEGADAMHAWVRAWCGHQMGWVEYDPTNALEVSADHIEIARGRDYSDVAPVRGVMRLAGDQVTSQAVDVIPVG